MRAHLNVSNQEMELYLDWNIPSLQRKNRTVCQVNCMQRIKNSVSSDSEVISKVAYLFLFIHLRPKKKLFFLYMALSVAFGLIYALLWSFESVSVKAQKAG